MVGPRRRGFDAGDVSNFLRRAFGTGANADNEYGERFALRHGPRPLKWARRDSTAPTIWCGCTMLTALHRCPVASDAPCVSLSLRTRYSSGALRRTSQIRRTCAERPLSLVRYATTSPTPYPAPLSRGRRTTKTSPAKMPGRMASLCATTSVRFNRCATTSVRPNTARSPAIVEVPQLVRCAASNATAPHPNRRSSHPPPTR